MQATHRDSIETLLLGICFQTVSLAEKTDPFHVHNY